MSAGTNSTVTLQWCINQIGQYHTEYNTANTNATRGSSSGMNYPDMNAINSNNNKSTCCHEDGGKYAVFEEVPASGLAGAGNNKTTCMCVVDKVYKVIYCACAQDKSLTNGVVDYCEYCRCYKCGGKNLPRDWEGSGTHSASSNAASILDQIIVHINPELVLLLGLYYVVYLHISNYTLLLTHHHLYIRHITLFHIMFLVYTWIKANNTAIYTFFKSIW